jgi:hypothetical protein
MHKYATRKVQKRFMGLHPVLAKFANSRSWNRFQAECYGDGGACIVQSPARLGLLEHLVFGGGVSPNIFVNDRHCPSVRRNGSDPFQDL